MVIRATKPNFSLYILSNFFPYLERGTWTDWSPWTECTEHCLAYNGTRYRVRDCKLNDVVSDARLCPGKFMEISGCECKG